MRNLLQALRYEISPESKFQIFGSIVGISIGVLVGFISLIPDGAEVGTSSAIVIIAGLVGGISTWLSARSIVYSNAPFKTIGFMLFACVFGDLYCLAIDSLRLNFSSYAMSLILYGVNAACCPMGGLMYFILNTPPENRRVSFMSNYMGINLFQPNHPINLISQNISDIELNHSMG
jgi:hypothetical protein